MYENVYIHTYTHIVTSTVVILTCICVFVSECKRGELRKSLLIKSFHVSCPVAVDGGSFWTGRLNYFPSILLGSFLIFHFPLRFSLFILLPRNLSSMCSYELLIVHWFAACSLVDLTTCSLSSSLSLFLSRI